MWKTEMMPKKIPAKSDQPIRPGARAGTLTANAGRCPAPRWDATKHDTIPLMNEGRSTS